MLIQSILMLLLIAPPTHGWTNQEGDRDTAQRKEARKDARRGRAEGAFARPETAAAPVRLVLPVGGLSEATGPRVKAALEGLVKRVMQCPSCQRTLGKEATCRKCEVGAKEVAVARLTDLQLSPAEGRIVLTLSGVGTVRLSELVAAVRAASVTVQEGDVPLPAPATLVFANGASGDLDLEALGSRLTGDQLYAGCRVLPDDGTGELHLQVRGGASHAPLGRALREALAREPRITKLELRDVAWGGPARPESAASRADAAVPKKRRQGDAKDPGELGDKGKGKGKRRKDGGR